MHNDSDLKIFYKDECVDFRNKCDPVMKEPLKSFNDRRKISSSLYRALEEQSKNEIKADKNERKFRRAVNTALKKLAKTYTSNLNPVRKDLVRRKPVKIPISNRFVGVQDPIKSLKSKSELSTRLNNEKRSNGKQSPSSPAIQSTCAYGDISPKEPSYRTAYTMTKPPPATEDSFKGKRLTKDKSLENYFDHLVASPSLLSTEQSRYPMWNVRRLAEKYSLLKVPWKRSHTLPICNSRPSLTATQEYYNRIREISDQKTYMYDDESEVDSALCLEPQRRRYKYSQEFHTQLVALLNISAYMCAIGILALIVWLLSGNKLYKFLIPKPPENTLKKFMKYIGGGIIYGISSAFKFVGMIFTIPTQQIFQPPPEYLWPPS